MSVFILNEAEWEFDFDHEMITKQVIEECLRVEAVDLNAEINVTLVHEEEMKAINGEQRQIESVTDVLSFPMLEFEEPGVFLTDEIKINLNPDTNEVMLGDIVICCERMEAQAAEYEHSILREYAFLIAHSMFHLMGYDHMTKEEEQQMFEKQDQVLNNLGITRGE